MTPQPEVRELSFSLLQDWLAFFDGEAFADNPDWAGCYCHFYHADHSEKDWQSRTDSENRTASTRLLSEGNMKGYLAYLDGKPVGWCQAGERASIANLANDQLLCCPEDGSVRVGSIVCFVVSKPYRHLGVARSLLDRACAGFREIGLTVAEGYPRRQATTDAANYHGPLSLFLKSGFAPYKELENVIIVRRPLD